MNNILHGCISCVLVSALSLCGLVQAQPQSPPEIKSPLAVTQHPDIETAFGKLPLAFEVNRGQADPAVKFFSRGLGYGLFLTAQEAVMVFSKSDKPQPVDKLKIQAVGNSQAAVIRMRFEGANKDLAVKGIEPLAYKTNYFSGADPTQHFTDITNHARVKYASIYAGIDAVFYGNQQQLEYDLVLAPRAKPQQIKLSFSGADKVSLSTEGDLVLATAVGDVTFLKPVAYQEISGKRKAVEAKYLLADNGRVSFVLGKYDVTRPLVIDPILSYSSFLWGSDAKGVAVDAGGNAYVTGYISTSDLPVVGGYKTTLTGAWDAYVIKIDPTGTKLLYATYLGASGATTLGYGIAVDGAGSAYIFGTTNSGLFPVTAGAYQRSSTGGSFVTKLNAAGNALAYSTFVNGANIAALALDSGGNAYVTGSAASITTTPGAFQSSMPSPYSSPFVAKLNSSGTAMVYATYLAGSTFEVGTEVSDTGKAIAVDASGNAYVTGFTASTNFPINQPFQSTKRGVQDAFVTKLNATGTALVYSSYLGGSTNDVGNGIAVDASGQAYVAGMTYSNDFPVTTGVFQPRKGKRYTDPVISNAFITKLSSTGTTLVYSSYLGGDWCLTTGVNSCAVLGGDGIIDAATAVAVDAVGYAYIGGIVTSVEFPLADSIHAVSKTGDGSRAPFVAKIKPAGDRLVYSVVIGVRTQDARLNGLVVDGNGSAYAVGYNAYAYGNGDYPITAAPLKTLGGDFIFKLSSGKYPTTVQSSLNPALSTQPITFSASVLSAKPGGTVTFMNGVALLGTSAMINGAASITTTLPSGVHKITATYSEDGKVSPAYFQSVNSQ